MVMEMRSSLRREIVSEFLGTAFLLATVIGSGIMGERLAGGNVATPYTTAGSWMEPSLMMRVRSPTWARF